ncbi:hypothetical protein KUG88_26080 [Rhodococcus rhodochrous]|uniref:hypothetical protein n=1 Tax=Rhodococcus rhodochrous TaxID=1829 RepID=UPI001E5A15E8|nr:hypothetical protein [Rhodococcus rhodochrous]MCB8913589.1 hypothetical protein [Rhodococcus rhodochrous]
MKDRMEGECAFADVRDGGGEHHERLVLAVVGVVASEDLADVGAAQHGTVVDDAAPGGAGAEVKLTGHLRLMGAGASLRGALFEEPEHRGCRLLPVDLYRVTHLCSIVLILEG